MRLLNYQHYQMVDIALSELSIKKGYVVETRVKWETLEPNLIDKVLKFKPIVYYTDGLSSSDVILEFPDAIVAVSTSKTNNEVSVDARSNSNAKALTIIKAIKKKIPVAPEPLDDEISLRFWYLSPNGPKSVHRNIAAPDWADINQNYTAPTRTGLNHLMSEFKPTSGGQLILWHGEPGTGKTYALRALCQSWKKWCSIEYIMDPETLLGSSPGYLASMIMNEREWDQDDDEDESTPPWKLLIMEDTGELLTEHARERSGQGLSRLLNVVDGFIGQGLRVLVLITTNEDFYKLHPAVSREGRCAASIKFDPLTANESIAFLKTKNISSIGINKPMNLSDLFGLTKESNMAHDIIGLKEKGNLGFRVPNAV